MPDSALVCGEPAALSATESVAAKLATEAGLKATEMEQLTPGSTVVLQVVLTRVKSPGLAPVRVIPGETARSGALPVFLRVTVWAVLVVPEVAEKVSVAGVSVATGAAAAVPVPESDAV